MRFRLGRKKFHENKTGIRESSLPPPAPSSLKADTPPTNIRRDQETGKRSVQFRDNRLPDGRQTCPMIPRPRLSTFDQKMQNQYEGRYSPTGSITSTSSRAIFPSLASYPVSYNPYKYQDYHQNRIRNNLDQTTRKYSDTYGFKSNTLRSHGRVASDFNIAKLSETYYDSDIPKPDYPSSLDCVKNINRDSGLDTDSRSSSGIKANTIDQHYYNQRLATEDDQINYHVTNGNCRRQFYQNFLTPLRSKNGNNISTDDLVSGVQKRPYDRNPRISSSLSNIPGRLYDNITIFDKEIRNDFSENFHKNCSTMRVRPREICKLNYVKCSSCSVCHDILDEIGRYSSVGTSTDIQELDQNLGSSLYRTSLTNKNPPSGKQPTIPPLCSEIEWMSIGDSDDFVYRPKLPSQKPSAKLRQDCNPPEEIMNNRKKLPRSQPMKALHESNIEKHNYAVKDFERNHNIIYCSQDEESSTSDALLKSSVSLEMNNDGEAHKNLSFIKL